MDLFNGRVSSSSSSKSQISHLGLSFSICVGFAALASASACLASNFGLSNLGLLCSRFGYNSPLLLPCWFYERISFIFLISPSMTSIYLASIIFLAFLSAITLEVIWGFNAEADDSATFSFLFH